MLYSRLADAIVLLHFGFLLFVVLGGLLALRWAWVAWIHLPAAIWGSVVELAGFVCPLTPLENHFRRLAGESGYAGGFIEHYVTALLYPGGLTRGIQVGLGVLVVVFNGWIYHRIVTRRRGGPGRARQG